MYDKNRVKYVFTDPNGDTIASYEAYYGDWIIDVLKSLDNVKYKLALHHAPYQFDEMIKKDMPFVHIQAFLNGKEVQHFDMKREDADDWYKRAKAAREDSLKKFKSKFFGDSKPKDAKSYSDVREGR